MSASAVAALDTGLRIAPMLELVVEEVVVVVVVVAGAEEEERVWE